MSNLLSSTEISSLTGTLGDHWDTFSDFSTITVHKEPKKTIVNSNANVYAGYDNSSTQTNVTYTPVSTSFKAIVKYSEPKTEANEDLQVRIPRGTVRIKVKEDARNYIETDKTERIDINGQAFNVISSDGVQNYLGLKFYYYILERIK